MAEIEKHNSKASCWVALYGKVYDLTDFLPEHPGGDAIVLKYAGKDGTKAFDPLHSRDILETLLDESTFLGTVDPKDMKPGDGEPDANAAAQPAHSPVLLKKGEKPPLSHMLNYFDFEAVARTQMTQEGWDYYSSGCDDEITLRENQNAFSRIWFKPRILINVKNIDMSCSILGYKSSFPVYITATALGKLAHPEGEVVLTRAAATHGIIQMCPTLASCSMDEMTGARSSGQIQFYQLYVNANKKITEKIVKKVERQGVKALFVTVDAPQLGRREKDMRHKFSAERPDNQAEGTVGRNEGTARAISSFIDPSLCWEDIKWLQTITKMPIILKGVQCGEDAIKAVEYGCQGVVLSNHGGRQLETARSAVEVLPECMAALRSINTDMSKFEVFVDGGIRRATDILKCIAMGATAVGIGRPALYSMASYGQAGVEHYLQLLKDEMEMNMRLLGTPTLKDVGPQHVITRDLVSHSGNMPQSMLAREVYIPLQTQLGAANARL